MKGNNKVLFSNDRLLESPIQSKIDKNLILMAHPIDGIVFFRVSNSCLIRKINSVKIGNQIGVLGIKEIKNGFFLLSL